MKTRTAPNVSLANMQALAREEFLKYQQAEGVMKAAIFTIAVTVTFSVIIGIANDLHSPRLQMVGIIGLALSLIICGGWTIMAQRRALAKFRKAKELLARYI